MRKIDTKTNYGHINLKIREVMITNGMSIYKLSKLTGLKYDVVKCYYYDSNYAYNLDTLAKICYVLECDINDILEYEHSYITIPINRN